MDTDFQTKVAQIFGDLLGYFGKCTTKVKTVVVTFRETIVKFGLLLIPHLVTLLKAERQLFMEL